MNNRGALMLLWIFSFGVLVLTILLGNELLFRTNVINASTGYTEPTNEMLLAEAGISHATFELRSAEVNGYTTDAYGVRGDFGVYSASSIGKNELTNADDAAGGWQAQSDATCRAYIPNAVANTINCYRYTFPLRGGSRYTYIPANLLGWVQATVINPTSRWPAIISRGSTNSAFPSRQGRTIRAELERAGNRFDYAIFAGQASPEQTTVQCHGFDLMWGAFVASYNSSIENAPPFKVGSPPADSYLRAKVGTNCDNTITSHPDTQKPGYIYANEPDGTTNDKTHVWGCRYYGFGTTGTDNENIAQINTPGVKDPTVAGGYGCNGASATDGREPLPQTVRFPLVTMPLPHRCDATELFPGADNGNKNWIANNAVNIVEAGKTYCLNALHVQGVPTKVLIRGTGPTRIYVRNWVLVQRATLAQEHATTLNTPAQIQAPRNVQIYLASTPTPSTIPSSLGVAACTGYHFCMNGPEADVRAVVYAPGGTARLTGGDTTLPTQTIMRGAIMARYVSVDTYAKLYYDLNLTSGLYADYGSVSTNSYATPQLRSWQIISDP